MVGFSGDDPNFLEWTGWIRDNLGSDRSPGIYLVDINPSIPRKNLLRQQNISLIDMSECADIGEGEYYNGLNRFIKYLLSRKKDKGFKWPRKQYLAPQDSEPEKRFTSPDISKDRTDQIKEVLSGWKRQRCSYPGWVTLPENLRRNLWAETRNWMNYVYSGDDLPEFSDLEFAFEISWRMEKCLCPMPNQQIRFFESVLGKYWNPDDWTDTEKDAATMCISLLQSMMRFYREEGLLEKWEAADEKVERVFESMCSEQKAIFYHERSLYAFFELDIGKLKNRLREWKTDESLPFFEAKRASLLAETGQVHEAEKILERSLKNIRAQLNLKPVKTDYSLVSREAVIMLLLQYVQKARLGSEGKPWDQLEVWDEFSERLHALKEYKCDPWNEIKIFRYALSGPPVEKPAFMEKQSFDVGRATQTINFGGFDEETLLAYRFLRFCEDAGIPFRVLNVIFEKEATKGTLSRIYKHSPYWAMATLARIGEQKAVEQIFNREFLTRLSVGEVDALIDKYLGALEKSSEEIQKGTNSSPDNFEKVLAKVLPEILSRLCCKCSLSAKHRLISFLLEIYKLDYRENYDGTDKLIMRLLTAFTARQRFDMIPELLDSPFSGSYNFKNPNPFDFLGLDKKLTKGWAKPSIPAEKIEDLFKRGSSVDRDARQWAVFTLGQLYLLDLLTSEQSEQFAEVLWDRVDDTGLPDQTYYYRFAFLDLPHPRHVNPVSLFKDYVHGSSFHKDSAETEVSGENVHWFELVRREVYSGKTAVPDNTISICRDIIAAKDIKWSDEEIRSIFQRIVKCWDSEKSKVRIEDSMSVRFGPAGFHARPKFEALVEVLVFVVAPNFDLDPENKDRKELLRLIEEFRDYGLPSLRLKTACLRIYPDFENQLFDELGDALACRDDRTVVDSLGAVLTMVTDYFHDKRNSKALSHLLDLLGQMIFWRNKTVLHATIKIVEEIIDVRPSLISGRFEKSILTGLKNIADDTAMDTENNDTSENAFYQRKERPD